MDGATELMMRWTILGSVDSSRILCLSSSVKFCVANASPLRKMWFTSTCVLNTGNPFLCLI